MSSTLVRLGLGPDPQKKPVKGAGKASLRLSSVGKANISHYDIGGSDEATMLFVCVGKGMTVPRSGSPVADLLLLGM